MRERAVVAFTAALLLAGAAQASTTISTLELENDAVFPWGLPDTAAYGQTFTLSGPAALNEVRFRIDDQGDSITFTAYLFGWSGTTVSGGALGTVDGSTAGVDGMETVTVDFAGVSLAAGQYLAFLQATSSPESGARWGVVAGSDPYADGFFVFQNNGGDTNLFTSAWNRDFPDAGSDLAFSISFESLDIGVIPLPGGLPLLLGALGLFGLAARRRRHTG